MSLSKKVTGPVDPKPSFVNKALNPNATEFVPLSLRSSPSSSSPSGSAIKTIDAGGKSVLGRSESSISNASDEEARQFWNNQLPDDLTPDFKGMGEDDSQGLGSMSLSSLSLHDINSDPTRFSPSGRFVGGSIVDDHNSPGFVDASKYWDKQAERDVASFNDYEMNPLEFLASQFPGFAAESLAQVYYTNGFDLNLTIEMLTQLELQVDVACIQNANPKGVPSPNLNSMEFPALAGNENLQTGIAYRPDLENLLMFKTGTSFPTRGASDFASAVRKLANNDSGMWKFERNGETAVGSSRSSHVLASAYGRGALPNRNVQRGAAPVWVETGEAVGNMYSALREEARDHARIRNIYLEQARQAYLIGNKALAKELSTKGQMYNLQMKAAHGKAQESIYRQRNPIGPDGRGQERMIDLHGLHVSEAVQVLKHELGALRSAVRVGEQRVQVYILVGTGHHTKGVRTPARLPVAVQRYLIEEEGLDFTEAQPGLLRVVIQ